ncbi:hypothetical protein [Burkholderia pseudomallei]|uniref:hypothetical protein n=1 Tax=Burkholderia pseudomallei TaxID=28450 RepID=UPI0011C4C59A|nr:hypothetical protein [Burkholderia pseudomallei]
MAKKNVTTAANRGRIQAQGGGIEESEPWADPVPLPCTNGLAKSNTLEAGLPRKERTLRTCAFQSARDFMQRCKENEGTGVTSKSYPVKDDKHRRVDIEVRAGKAFV